MAKNVETLTPSRNILGCGTKLKGDIESNGDFRIDGTLAGTIKTNGKVVIGSTGVVEGEIICQNADIEGSVKAKLEVSELLTLKAESKLDGDVTTGKLAIEPGAIFSGTCRMGGEESVPKAPLMNEKNKLERENGLKSYAKYSSIALQMLVIILIGVFGGVKLDKWIAWEFPVFTIVFSILSVFLAIYYVTRDLLKKR